MPFEPKAAADYIIKWLNDYKTKNHIRGFIVGISGGIDSAVVSTLCAKTGSDTLVLEMPIHQDSTQVDRGREHIEWLQKSHQNVRSYDVDLTKVFDTFEATVTPIEKSDKNADNQMALANVRSRLRMVCLYYFASLHGYVVVGTGNKVEDFGVGFFTKYGDGGVDISPIADLMKSEVRAVARELGVCSSIIAAPPTDGLFGDSRTDEDQIGATYDELEWAMNHLDDRNNASKHLDERQKQVIDIYNKRHSANLHKMIEIPRCILKEQFQK
ncbi:unnamed protein product [Didymodactylos carnosus]|uniref:NAD/GMP synthase domain-containing protein n=1 Tax=Didymodactylos carnosus TaxID=1234261 RepID=A0A815FX85_9BILA|nr:unnamed protein product [Didymodactylos carnosus]CAF1331114.1 unnamed protein product [Didymodactylos carnosus]CAF4010597.1 unnamed protein product [Didymodactylos carnosus]CAF4184630.1 unnamed protein product [Didymodactylos carnosus]